MMHAMGRYGGALDEELGPAYNQRVVMRLLRYARPYRWLILFATVTMLLYTFTAVATPWLIQRAIDSVVADRDSGQLVFFSALLLSNAALGYLTNFVYLFTLSNLGQKVLLDLRADLFNHLQSLSVPFFDRREVGETMSRVQNDVQSLQEYLSIFILAVGDLVTIGGIIVAMFLMDWQLAAITLAVIPLLAVITVVWQRRAWRLFLRVRQLQAVVNSGLQENISGIRVIQSLNRTRENTRNFVNINNQYLDSTLKAARISALLLPVVDILTALALGSVILFGGVMALRNELEVGVLVAFALYIQRFFDPIRNLITQYSQLQRAMTAGSRIFELMDVKPEVYDQSDAIILPTLRGEIEFQQVYFSYTPDSPVLTDINLRVRPGERLALVGATGAGKTTLVSLVARFYDVTQGRLLIDGYDVRDAQRNSLTRQIAMVLQEPYLFSGSVRDNIRYSHPEASDQFIEEVARAVGAHDFITRLENGYDTQMHERGSNLSAGQRQLIALARALVADPRIVILDEATSTIDSRTEGVVQAALETLLQGRTALIIAHRLSTVRHADRIIVLEQGRIVEEGPHEELLARNGVYARLYHLNYVSMEPY